MSKQPDELAFPYEEHNGDGTLYKDHFGMTLRDYFAAQALNGIAGHFTGPKERAGETAAQAHARWSYNVADAMIAERAK